MRAIAAVTTPGETAALGHSVGLARASFYRRRRPTPSLPPPPSRAPSPRALAADERQAMLDTLHSERFVDQSPAEVHATLLEEQTYLGSVRTMYRVLAEAHEVRERRAQARHPVYTKPELVATGPNQVWSWDITKLKGPIPYLYSSLYVILDLFSRYVVGWMVARHENAHLAERLIAATCLKQGIAPQQLTIHADRGAPMRSKLVALLFSALLRGSKTDPQRPLPTDPLTTDRVRRRPTKLSHLIEDVTCEDGLRLLPRPTARSKALPDDQRVPEEGVLHTGLLMVARVLLPLSPSSLLHLSDRAVARGRSWSPSRHGGCPGRWNDDRRATRTRSLVDATRVVGRVRREAGDVAFDLVDQIEGRRRVVNMPAGQGVSDDHARSVDAQMKLLPAAYTASAMFHGRPFTFTHSREPGTVDDEMYACARGEAAKCKVEVLTTP